MQIVQGPDVVVVRQEALHASQMVYLDGRPRPAADVHLDKGVSRGHWEGDTLVVDSTNFAPWGVGNFSAYGTTDKLHIIERWKRLDDTHLLYGFTVDDPGTWTKPWSVEYVMWRLTTQEELVEYACNEGNVGIHFTLTAAREREKAEAAAAAKEAAQPEPGVEALAGAPAAPKSVNYATNGLGMEFSQIPPGEFLMGCSVDAEANECDKDEKPRHLVQITKPFEIQRTEVTQKLWQTLMGSNPAAHKGDVNFPVETVSFLDVQQFLTKLNAQNDGYVYRLPTEAEWEYAERAGTTQQYAWEIEKTQSGDRGARGPLETRPVASKKPNGWGLYDTRGDVTEWVQDWYDPTYYSDSPKVDPKGPATGELRVVRGGSFRGYARQVYPFLMRASVRTKFPEAYSFNDIGFRVAREKK
jgi:formylglycine-generating enzyme required for sulfatase activity